MKNTLKLFVRRTPIYTALRTMQQRRELREWERCGRPDPPPHIVKQRVIRELAGKFGTRVMVETGTYYGDMVEAMKNHFSRIYSIELSKELHEKARQRFAGDNRIEIIHGDSGIELGKLIARLDQAALFWLDGHYSGGLTAMGDKYTPIYEELTHLFGSPHQGHVIIIDDARCFGTYPGYPSMEELSRFIAAKNPHVKIEVENDGIRIIPSRHIDN